MFKSGNKENKPSRWRRDAADTAPEASGEDMEQKSGGNKFFSAVSVFFKVLYHLRALFMAIPVVIAALRLAAHNSENLPLQVGINLLSTGEFERTISRSAAVTFPLLITGGCLVLTMLSRKNLYPWLISIFSLAIPVLLYFTNVYPM